MGVLENGISRAKINGRHRAIANQRHGVNPNIPKAQLARSLSSENLFQFEEEGMIVTANSATNDGNRNTRVTRGDDIFRWKDFLEKQHALRINDAMRKKQRVPLISSLGWIRKSCFGEGLKAVVCYSKKKLL